MANLNGYSPIPAGATVGGAPIDAFLVDSLRSNDVFFEKMLQAMLASPWMPSGTDTPDEIADPDPRKFVNAKRIVVNTQITLTQKVPLVWFAREKITLKHEIIATAKGADKGETGDFGGGGGWGGADGPDCKFPVSGVEICKGGRSASKNGADLPAVWASRALSVLALCKGGAGGNSGGATGSKGGGVVFLCAPEIIFEGANAKIAANGEPAHTGSNGGGGGGGLVVLIGRRISGAVKNTNITVTAGAKDNTGGNGGKGAIIIREIK
ncbi:MAG: hypothetical protein AAFZ15_20035 [Bacteroidota bacterium]